MTHDDLAQVIPEERMEAFHQWMVGQTQAICEGRIYDHDAATYRESCGGVAHGVVAYRHDVARFLNNQPVID